MPTLFSPKKNCWRVEHTQQLRMLVDGRDYFKALREAIINAQRSIYIFSWDIHSRLELVREAVDDGYPRRLDALLNAVAAKKPQLNVYILSWDFSMLFALDREWAPIYHLDWKTHNRVHFKLDDHHPPGASHHQKIVVIDNALAFIGGLDLTKGRWDTSEHIADNTQRDHDGEKIFRPYHDVQIMVSGHSAAAMGQMFRSQWRRLNNEELEDIPSGDIHSLWPQSFEPDMHDINVALARTRPAYKEIDSVKEIEKLYLDAIARAKQSLYIENQYFTAPYIVNALEARLQEPDGPEIILVLPLSTDGWLANYTMDVIRIRLINRLIKADKYKRFLAAFPHRPDLDHNPVNVHSKLLFADDEVFIVGSANLNNRSMALDYECNIAVDAGESKQPEQRQQIAAMRNRLVGEHMGCSSEDVKREINQKDSLLDAIDRLTHPDKMHLRKLPLELPSELDSLVPDTDIVDPEVPIEPETLIKRILPEDTEKSARYRVIQFLGLITLILALAAMWHWSPLQKWIDIQALARAIESFENLPGASLLAIAAFIIAGFIAFPFTLLLVATILVFGPVWGSLYAFTGGTVSALLTYQVGNFLGRSAVRKLAGSRINRISRHLARHGVITIVAVRVIPVAPFTVINIVAGASHINFRDYILGTVLGMAPGIVAITLIMDRIQATMQEPSLGNVFWLLILILVFLIMTFYLLKWLMRRTQD